MHCLWRVLHRKSPSGQHLWPVQVRVEEDAPLPRPLHFPPYRAHLCSLHRSQPLSRSSSSSSSSSSCAPSSHLFACAMVTFTLCSHKALSAVSHCSHCLCILVLALHTALQARVWVVQPVVVFQRQQWMRHQLVSATVADYIGFKPRLARDHDIVTKNVQLRSYWLSSHAFVSCTVLP